MYKQKTDTQIKETKKDATLHKWQAWEQSFSVKSAKHYINYYK
jgi:hypothetical protein